MIVIGVDAHKASHTAVAVDRQTAEHLGAETVPARPLGHQRLLDWARELDGQRVWAIEDCRNLSSGLERVLLEAGEHVLRVPSKLMARERKAARTHSKSDPIDALAVARAAIREPGLPEARLPGVEREIGMLVAHRDALVRDAANHQRRLRWHLHELDPELDIPVRGMAQPAQQQRLKRWLARQPQTTQVVICRDLLRRVCELTRHVKQLQHQLDQLVRDNHPELLGIPGCGPLSAATIIAEVDGIARFKTDAQLATYAGVAPLDASSGKQQRHRLNRTGNRQLNRALHMIAVTQIRVHPPAAAYYARRKADGKTNREALRALKRHLARTIHTTLKAQPLT